MIDLIKIDPFLYGYFENEALEHGERVGLALLCAAKNLEIKFSRQCALRYKTQLYYNTPFALCKALFSQ